MRRRYQSGGRADIPANLRAVGEELQTFPREESGPIGVGALDPNTLMMITMSEAFGRTTTPEAQNYARRLLERQLNPDESARESILQGKKTQAEAVREALRTARSRLEAQQFGRSELLLGIGRGLGMPTRTGALGETASNVAGQVADPIRRQREFGQERDAALTELDLAEAQADEGYIDAEFQLNKLEEEIQGRLAQEALQTLGKTTSNFSSMLGKVLPESVKALDTEYIKEYYLPWKAGGDTRMDAGLARLRFAEAALRGDRDALTGPYIGLVANIPWVGRWAQGYISPSSAEVRDLVERTIQEDLRPTLGSQFTQTEGENLIARTFNMSLEEPRNARRINQLIRQLEAARDNRKEMADYFDANQTLFGFRGKFGYTEDDFQFEDDDQMDGQGAPSQSGERVRFEDLPPNEQDIQRKVWEEINGRPAPFKRGGRVRKRYQQGGIAFPDERRGNVIFPGEEPETNLRDELDLFLEDYGDPMGAVAGGTVGLLGNAALDTLAERVVGGTERRVADAIESGGLDPIMVAEDIKRNRRAGVPETLMDVDTAAMRNLATQAFEFGDAPAEEALRELRNRLEGSRERVNERINTGLKPYEFFEHDDKLVRELTTERSQEMRDAFAKYQTVPNDPVLRKILATPEGERAVDWAFRFYENDPRRGKIDRAAMLANPTLEFHNFVRKGFNQTIAREEAKGSSEFGGVLRDLRKMYLDRLGKIAPEYSAALAAEGDDLAVRDALHAGRVFMRKQPQELAAISKGLSFHERNAFRTGMAQHLYEVLDRATGENFNAAQRIVGSPAMLARLEPFFDNAQQFKIFQTALERESELMRIGKDQLRAGESARVRREGKKQNFLQYAAQRAPGLRFAISLPGWALRIFRDMPEMTPREAERVLGVIRRGRPEEMNAFATRVKRLRTLRGTRMGRRGAAAAIGAGAGALLGGDEEEE